MNTYGEFEQGDDVYLRCGSLFTQEHLVADWGGTESDYAIIGAYYDVEDVETIGVNEEGKPIIDGEESYPPVDSHIPLMPSSESLPIGWMFGNRE